MEIDGVPVGVCVPAAVIEAVPVPDTVPDNVRDCVGAADTEGDMMVGDALPVPVADAFTAHR
jgi:hypothetical protein